MVAEVARFYGFGHLEIMEMNCDEFISYYKCIKKIRAKEMIEECKVNEFSNLPAKDKKDRIRSLERQAFDDKPKKVLTMDELMRAHV